MAKKTVKELTNDHQLLSDGVLKLERVEVTNKLNDVYGSEYIDLKGPLPAHLLSDMWGRFWNNLYRFAEPFSGKPAIDPTPAMKEQNYTVLKMFQTGDDFYAAMGLYRVPETF